MSALPLVQDDHRPLQQLRRVRSHRCLSTDSQSAYLQNPEKRGKYFRVREDPLQYLQFPYACPPDPQQKILLLQFHLVHPTLSHATQPILFFSAILFSPLSHATSPTHGHCGHIHVADLSSSI